MFKSEASSCAMAPWCSWCALGPESKMSGRNQSPFGGSHLFCSTNESDFQAGGGGGGWNRDHTGAHTCVVLPCSLFQDALREIELFARL